MESLEKIQNKRRINIFNQLQEDKTLLKMRLLGKSYERLTVVTDVRIKNGTPFFLVDFPEDFHHVIGDVRNSRIHFEFLGKDRIKYNFRTSGGEISGDKIYIKVPEVIERQQRRKHYRLSPPVGTKIYVKTNAIVFELNVINISLGGALCATVNGKMGGSKGLELQPRNTLKNLSLVFSLETESLSVLVKKAVVKRVEKDPITLRENCSIHFIDIEKEEEKALNEFIYRFQREFLRNRPPIIN
jgi:c-di-GMP-binding flagellar brake protein YcgR